MIKLYLINIYNVINSNCNLKFRLGGDFFRIVSEEEKNADALFWKVFQILKKWNITVENCDPLPSNFRLH